MPNRNVILAAVFLAATIIPAHFNQASANSLVKTKAQCTRYGGNLMRNGGPDKAAYPWVCDTPVQDRKCIKQFGNRGYFDAEFGKCRKLTQEEYDCQIYQFDWCFW